MNTGEDVQGLRKIADFTRLISIFVLAIHVYLTCYEAFIDWGFTAEITDRLVAQIARTGLFQNVVIPKLAALLLLGITLLAAKGKKDEKVQISSSLAYLLGGLCLYFASAWVLYLPVRETIRAVSYIGITAAGYLLILSGGTLLSRLVNSSLDTDVFNTAGETFPQEERLLTNEYSVNLPARYRLKSELRKSWINIVNPFRGLLVAGTPGSGKSYFVIRHIIDQHLRKGFSMLLYDFKFDDLSLIAYNTLLKYYKNYKVKPTFWVINFDKILHRCNPLYPESMDDLTDATDSSRTIMLGLNRDWIKKQGDFFVESAINFLAAIIWYLKKYEQGRYCTLPHAIELMQTDYDRLFALLMSEEEIQVLINPFVSAYLRKAMPQVEGQIASAKISLARLASPQLYYVLSGNDFTLDINNPKAPKIVCLGNNPQKLQVYGAVLSLYISRMIKLVNRKNQLKSSLVFDEFPTIYFAGMDSLIATARSNKVATALAVQDFSQLKKDYGAEQASVLTGIVGNVISGQVTGETAKRLSESFGKIMQERESRSISSSDVSVSRSRQLEYAIPASRIASLSSGEFVGMVADTPQEKIRLKMFHAEIQNDHAAIAAEEAGYREIPAVGQVTRRDVMENYYQIKEDIYELLKRECGRIEARQRRAEELARKNAEKQEGLEAGECREQGNKEQGQGLEGDALSM
ncbi:type IV secretory system conjugative DNA transfer VirD4/TraG family protein [Anseongella ginsenosidimutans]|uniref:Type IV secretory system conjugative DNA transfer VirD4/TraG family protein n=1 Tax=Anseongella ginsenosidimutans TaxID=496056 RepID=A0A4R3KJM0_9SPHI|nr:conjugal transfer protein MobC [Anseongella ginsenosidimutans]QEC53620.1 conjugal transfer protein TraG [Anseongella ginsenosidimutans]TCS83923.1 type IV secretory system conjugative DNA transfer VirD4/TraG family protein [Anseongella ginsenosidimutans]